MKPIALIIMLAGLLLSVEVSAHGGRTDSNGGHFNRKTNVYHCHSSSCSQKQGKKRSSSYSSRSSGSSSPGLRPSERATLERLKREKELKKLRRKQSVQKKTYKENNDRYAKARQQRTCESYKAQIDSIQKQLRKGYKPSTGNYLKKRRRYYSNKIYDECM